MATVGQGLPKGYYRDSYGNIKKASGIGAADYNPQASIDYLNKLRGETPVVSNTPTAPQEQSIFSGLQNKFSQGLSNLQNNYNKYTGNNYVMDNGVMTGGLGNYATYNGVGLSKEAYDAIQNPYVSEGMTAAPVLEGVTVNQPTTMQGLWSGIGGAKGLADIAGGLSSLGGLYYGMKENDRREGEYNARMAEINRQRQRDIDWQNNINKSGLGTYSAGVK